MTSKVKFAYPVPPESEINGHSVLATLAAFGRFRSLAEGVLAENGITNVQATSWYSTQAQLYALFQLRERVGDTTLTSIGQKVPEHSVFPPDMDSAHKALSSMQTAYMMNHRNGDIGTYRYEKRGETTGAVVARNPYPCPLDKGLITALVRRFAPLGQVDHDPSSCRDKGGRECTYVATW